MCRITSAESVTGVLLQPGDAAGFTPIPFRDDAGEFLCLAGCEFTPRPVLRFSGKSGQGEIRRTANGEVVSFDDGENFVYREYMDKCREVSGENLRSDFNDFSYGSEQRIETQFLNIFLYLIAFLSLVTMASALFMIRNF